MRKWPWIDVLASLVLLCIALSYAGWLNFARHPFEDAAMLMRYSVNLANGHGIVWNIGQPPVDGATDFLFMVMVAAVVKTGLSVELAARGLGFGAHLLTVLLIYWVNRRLWDAPAPLALFCAWYFAASTGLSYVAAMFGTPVFALAATVTWVLALRMVRTREMSTRAATWFALSGLVTGLIRPEGVILASLMALSIAVANGWRASLRTLAIFGGVFLVLGGAYFLWRWSYFDYPLPNPYYKKGAGALHWDSLQASLLGYARFAWPLWPMLLLGLRSKARLRLFVAMLLPPTVFASAFILVSNEMNFGGRFQYVTLPLLLISWMPLCDDVISALGGLWDRAQKRREHLAWGLAAFVAAFMMIRYSAAQRCVFDSAPELCRAPGSGGNGLYDAARLLAVYRDRGYVLATTEAGLLPLYSGWRAIDAWGLNDQWIAHHGAVTEEYLDRFRPHVIVSHAYFGIGNGPPVSEAFTADPWNRMSVTLRNYALSRGYVLAGAFGLTSNNLHYYYVRPDFSDSSQIAAELRSLRYGWYGTAVAMNWAQP